MVSTECSAEQGFTFPAYPTENNSSTLNFNHITRLSGRLRPKSYPLSDVKAVSRNVRGHPQVKARVMMTLHCNVNLKKGRLSIFLFTQDCLLKNTLFTPFCLCSTLLASTSFLDLTTTVYQERIKFVYNSAHDSRKSHKQHKQKKYVVTRSQCLELHLINGT